MIRLGPILSLRGATAETWQISAIVVADADPGPLRWTIAGKETAVPSVALWTLGGHTVWRFVLDLPRSARAVMSYSVAGQTFDVSVPAAEESPRCAYVSCNGFSNPRLMTRVRAKNAMWSRMDGRHGLQPYDLLLMGGDQVYADAMLETVDLMQAWNELSFKAGNEAPCSDAMRDALEAFYFNLYCERWSQPEVAAMLARVPIVAMWDDHDLIDGWGSYPADRQNCPVFDAIGEIARKAFRVFQQQLPADGNEAIADAIAPEFGFSRGHVIGRTAILALDMRSERTPDRVLSLGHWAQVYAWIDRLKDVDHLLVMSSIPVVYPGFDTIEAILGFLPGQQQMEDDFRDHWNSRPHKGERQRLIHRLLDVAERRICPTIVSGDVHVAALGLIESTMAPAGRGIAVNQLISSAVVHPGPPAIVLFALRHLFDSSDEIEPGIVARMTKFPGLPTSFIGARNFLSLEPDTQRRIWANWIVENETEPYTKVIHPLLPEAARPATPGIDVH